MTTDRPPIYAAMVAEYGQPDDVPEPPTPLRKPRKARKPRKLKAQR